MSFFLGTDYSSALIKEFHRLLGENDYGIEFLEKRQTIGSRPPHDYWVFLRLHLRLHCAAVWSQGQPWGAA